MVELGGHPQHLMVALGISTAQPLQAVAGDKGLDALPQSLSSWKL